MTVNPEDSVAPDNNLFKRSKDTLTDRLSDMSIDEFAAYQREVQFAFDMRRYRDSNGYQTLGDKDNKFVNKGDITSLSFAVKTEMENRWGTPRVHLYDGYLGMTATDMFTMKDAFDVMRMSKDEYNGKARADMSVYIARGLEPNIKSYEVARAEATSTIRVLRQKYGIKGDKVYTTVNRVLNRVLPQRRFDPLKYI